MIKLACLKMPMTNEIEFSIYEEKGLFTIKLIDSQVVQPAIGGVISLDNIVHLRNFLNILIEKEPGHANTSR